MESSHPPIPFDQQGLVALFSLSVLTIKLDLSILATPIPELSSAVLYLVALAAIAPFVTRARRAGAG